jgi:hypothetical protein
MQGQSIVGACMLCDFCTTCHVQIFLDMHMLDGPIGGRNVVLCWDPAQLTPVCVLPLYAYRDIIWPHSFMYIELTRHSARAGVTYDTTESLDFREACAHECILYSGIGTRDYCNRGSPLAKIKWKANQSVPD